MQIREAPIEEVLKIRQEAMYPHLPLEELRLKEDGRGKHIGLYLGEELVSVISVFIEQDELRFRKFATRTDWQGRGYGGQLFLHVLKMAETLGCRKIWCHARISAKGFYGRYGLRPVGDTWYQQRIEFVKMEKLSSMEIIPAIDIIDGKCVRLTQGDYDQKKIYNEYPLEIAKEFEDAGLRRLHLVDLDGAKAGAVKNWKVLEAIAGKTGLVIDFGGGIKTAKDVDIVLGSGAALATIGSIAVKDPALFTVWLQAYGPERFLLGADVKEEKITVGGWLETTDTWVYDFIEGYLDKGVKQVFCTDVGKDGLLEGPSLELYRNILARFPGLRLIASGGVSGMDDVYRLAEMGCSGVIIGKAIYEGRVTLAELSGFNK